MAAVRGRMDQFNEELKMFSAECNLCTLDPALNEALTKLTTTIGTLQTAVRQEVNLAEPLVPKYDQLQEKLFKAYQLQEEATLLQLKQTHPQYQHLLKARPLDPASEKTWDELQQLSKGILLGLTDVDNFLTQEHRQHVRSQQAVIQEPLAHVNYRTLREIRKVQAFQESKVETLAERLDALSIAPSPSRQALQPVSSALPRSPVKRNRPFSSQRLAARLRILRKGLLAKPRPAPIIRPSPEKPRATVVSTCMWSFCFLSFD